MSSEVRALCVHFGPLSTLLAQSSVHTSCYDKIFFAWGFGN